MDQKMETIRSGNELKLEQMRKTVEEKLTNLWIALVSKVLLKSAAV